MRVIGLLFLAGTAIAQAPTFRPVATVSQIMIAITYPYSDALLYIERNPPQQDRDWEALERQALMLAESGNLLMMEGRAKDQGEWMKDARLLVEAGVAAVKATHAKDLQAVLALNDQIVTACTTCHTQYHPRYLRRRANNK
jgi:cytochrome c553